MYSGLEDRRRAETQLDEMDSGLKAWIGELPMTPGEPAPSKPSGARLGLTVSILMLTATALWALHLQLRATHEEATDERVVLEPTARPAGPAPATATAPRATALPRPSAPPVPAIPPKRPRPALLYLSSRPWGFVYVDDRRVGHTPIRELAVTPGRHLLRITRPGFRPYERLIDVAPGNKLWLTGIDLPSARP